MLVRKNKFFVYYNYLKVHCFFGVRPKIIFLSPKALLILRAHFYLAGEITECICRSTRGILNADWNAKDFELRLKAKRYIFDLNTRQTTRDISLCAVENCFCRRKKKNCKVSTLQGHRHAKKNENEKKSIFRQAQISRKNMCACEKKEQIISGSAFLGNIFFEVVTRKKRGPEIARYKRGRK